LFDLKWEVRTEIPSLGNVLINYNEVNEGIFTESPLAPPADNLPDSIVNPLLFKEIQMRIPVEVQKKFHDFNLYCLDSLQKTAWDLKDKMHAMVEEAGNHIKSGLDNAGKQMEDHEI